MEGLGYSPDALRARNPGLVAARLDAYGWTGPWALRRGFDSLVQMSTGIAAAPTDGERPRPLPAQALDHGTGYLLATAVVRGLARRLLTGEPVDVAASLLATAGLVLDHPGGTVGERPPFEPSDTVEAVTAWGPARVAPCPVDVAGCPPRWDVPAGPLGRDAATFAAP
jgi:crotonobetainyl-CoA:carnitine CoA-transferase CaiB-like acyl-CoA transferase